MKFKLLFILIWVVSNYAYSQQNNNLRGIRYYYSTPSYGSFGNSINNFKPLQIEETNKAYLLSGYLNMGINPRACFVKIDKSNDAILFDFLEDSWSISKGILCSLENQVLLIYDKHNDMLEQDSMGTVLIDSNGVVNIHSYATDTIAFIKSVNQVKFNTNLATGLIDISSFTGTSPSAWPYGFPVIYRLDNTGQQTQKKVLPIFNIFQNLPVIYGSGIKTFAFGNDYITFGNIHRLRSIGSNEIRAYPSYWRWNEDTTKVCKEVFLDYPGHDNGKAFGELIQVAGANKEFAISIERPNENTPNSQFTPNPVILTYLDSNFHIIWERQIGSLPQSSHSYQVEDIKIDSISGFIYLTGWVYNYTTDKYFSFLSKYRKNGPIVFIKHFIIDEDNSIHTLKISENGDLIFAGRGRHDGLNCFFTFRTDQDGYDPAGQYLGLEVVTATPTEIGIFPNPSDGIFQVSSLSEEPMLITMLDQQGKQVVAFELNELSSKNSFDLSEQAPGVYFAHISQGENQWVKKLVVR